MTTALHQPMSNMTSTPWFRTRPRPGITTASHTSRPGMTRFTITAYSVIIGGKDEHICNAFVTLCRPGTGFVDRPKAHHLFREPSQHGQHEYLCLETALCIQPYKNATGTFVRKRKQHSILVCFRIVLLFYCSLYIFPLQFLKLFHQFHEKLHQIISRKDSPERVPRRNYLKKLLGKRFHTRSIFSRPGREKTS